MSSARRSIAAICSLPIRRRGADAAWREGEWGGEDSRDLAAVILDHMAIDGALAALRPADRAVMELLYAYRSPPGYTGYWPATATEVGRYLGATFPEFRGRPVTARTVWRRHAAILALWRAGVATVVTRRAA